MAVGLTHYLELIPGIFLGEKGVRPAHKADILTDI
jgi:hypothetical protein